MQLEYIKVTSDALLLGVEQTDFVPTGPIYHGHISVDPIAAIDSGDERLIFNYPATFLRPIDSIDCVIRSGNINLEISGAIVEGDGSRRPGSAGPLTGDIVVRFVNCPFQRY